MSTVLMRYSLYFFSKSSMALSLTLSGNAVSSPLGRLSEGVFLRQKEEFPLLIPYYLSNLGVKAEVVKFKLMLKFPMYKRYYLDGGLNKSSIVNITWVSG